MNAVKPRKRSNRAKKIFYTITKWLSKVVTKEKYEGSSGKKLGEKIGIQPTKPPICVYSVFAGLDNMLAMAMMMKATITCVIIFTSGGFILNTTF